MDEKTNVTNSEVPESSQTLESPSGEGQNPSNQSSGRSEENRRKETERKAREQSWREQQETRFSELQEQMQKLTLQNQQYLKQLEQSAAGDDPVSQLERDPQTKPWATLAERKAQAAAKEMGAKAKEEAIFEIQLEQQRYFLEDVAEENSMEFEDLYKELQNFAAKHMNVTDPYRRAQKAYKDWKVANKERKEVEELRDQARKQQEFREGAGRVQRESGKLINPSEAKSDADFEHMLNNIDFRQANLR